MGESFKRRSETEEVRDSKQHRVSPVDFEQAKDHIVEKATWQGMAGHP